MKLIVCIDEQNGMLFNQRRVSRDSAVLDKISTIVGEETLWMDPYSQELFAQNLNGKAFGDFLDRCGFMDWCFVENRDVSSYIDKITTVVVFKWNRRYPSDLKFPWQIFEKRWAFMSSEDFVGTSHDRITCEVYKL